MKFRLLVMEIVIGMYRDCLHIYISFLPKVHVALKVWNYVLAFCY
jgi:hypothetical protein